ncbi:MAG: META domain-containing protein [Anaerolineae bacterium]|nr:META domain-containing protein [Anaerolineae bacterium]
MGRSSSPFFLSWRGVVGVVIAGLLLVLIWAWVPAEIDPDCSLGENGAWISVDWTSKPVVQAEVEQLAREVTAYQLGTLLPFVTYVKADGTFSRSYDHAVEFVSVFRQSSRETRLLAWIGIPLQNDDGLGVVGWVDLSRAAERRRIVDFVAWLLTEADFDLAALAGVAALEPLYLWASRIEREGIMFRNRTPTIMIVILVMTIVLGACRSTDKPATPPTGAAVLSLENSEWILVALNGQGLVQGSNITLAFAEGKASGFAGCNGYGGRYTATDKGSLTMAEIAITEMYCMEPAGAMAQETAYVKALMSAAAYRMVGDRLEIDNGAGETILIFDRTIALPMDPADLVGSEWQLVSWNGERPVEGARINLAFDQDTFGGHAGCRGYRGTYEAEGDTLRFTFIEMLGEGCSDRQALMVQEDEYTTRLEQTAHYRLGKGQLELLTARGEVVLYESLADEVRQDWEGQDWVLVSFLAEGAVMPVLEGPEVTVTFENGEVRGSAGCNSYSGSYTVDGFRLSVGMLAVTEMACMSPAGVMEQEQLYLRFLADAFAHTLEDGVFRLEMGDGRSLVFGAGE